MTKRERKAKKDFKRFIRYIKSGKCERDVKQIVRNWNDSWEIIKSTFKIEND